MMTIAEFAKRYDLPESTARFYCKRFRDFLPHSGQGKRRRYLDESIPVFEAILEGMGNSKNAAAVEEFLARRFQRRGVTQPPKTTPAASFQTPLESPQAADPASLQMGALVQSQTEALKQMTTMLQELVQKGFSTSETSPEETRLADRLEALESKVDELSKEVRGLRALQDEAERIHQQDLEQLRKWLSHLAKEQSRVAK